MPPGTVLLDMRRNRYFGLDEAGSRTLTDLLSSGEAMPSSEPLISNWLRAGLLQTTPCGQRRFSPEAIDLHRVLCLDELVHVPRHVRMYDLACFCWQTMTVHRELRTQTLYSIACALHAQTQGLRPPKQSVDPRVLARTVNAFRSLRPYAFAARERCLFHALALTRFIIAHGIDATWVIGVRLRPWGAHSWVQHGEYLLDTTAEAVRDFKPIIAV